MAGPADFVPIKVGGAAVADAKARYAGMGNQALGGSSGWAGFAAEIALMEAINGGSSGLVASPAQQLGWDFTLAQRDSPEWDVGPTINVEVKTRVAETGWIHPARYDWIVVPTHDGREPMKPAADMILFCWYPLEQPRLWVLGCLWGLREFQRRSIFYREDEPLPRGGWAGPGGAYALDVKDLRPLPRGLLKEDADG